MIARFLRDPLLRGQILRTAMALAVLVLPVSAATLVVAAGPAAAHNVLRGVSPEPDSTVDATPEVVVLTFDEPALKLGTELVVTGPDGEVQDGAAELVDETVRQPLQPGAPAGEYSVAWRVTSIDGHPISGTFNFTSTAADPRGGQEESTGTPSTAAPTDSTTTLAGEGTDAGGGGTLLWVGAGAVLLVAVGALVLARRRSGPPSP